MNTEPTKWQQELSELFRHFLHCSIVSSSKQITIEPPFSETSLHEMINWMVDRTEYLTRPVRFTFVGERARNVCKLLDTFLGNKPSALLDKLGREGSTPVPSIDLGLGFICIGIPGVSAADVTSGEVKGALEVMVCDTKPQEILVMLLDKIPGVISPAVPGTSAPPSHDKCGVCPAGAQIS